MQRLFSIVVLLLAATGGSLIAQEPAGPKTEAKAISLRISDTGQEKRRPESGWCGEAAIQMALAYYGGYASQQAINRAGKPAHPDLYEGEIPLAISNVGLESSAWTGDGLEAFLKWIRGQLAAGRPILLGVKIYPTEHPEWALDHFVLAVGCSEETLTYNTTWGKPETKTFARLSNRENGISFVNRSGTYFGHAITGMKIKPGHAGLKPARVAISQVGDKQVRLRVNVEELQRGTRYQLLKFTDLATAVRADAKGEVVKTFVADGANKEYIETIGLDDARVYRCVPAP